ncbi:YciI family protein [Pusillimonas sp.]|uniref:YciI family protein n=1 Tax=Pusillimonas sp. TaxID=3040095 RepID=UPI0029A403E5|nr:YciI family protein [Pusillimonas sp.]MDX3895228.1 YciI family protein [Pusillimonas sp.]
MTIPAQAQALMQAMLNKPLYVALRTPVDLSRINELLSAHLEWVVQCERRGELFASGPFVAGDGPPGAHGGMSIFRADSVAEAQRILSGDPFIQQGVFTAEIKKWMLMEGGMTVTLRFSDQSYLLR